MESKKLEKLIEKLNNLVIIPLNGMKEILHSYGLNIKYLGKIAEKVTSIHVKSLCKLEMAARSIKKIIRFHMSEFYLNKSDIDEVERTYEQIETMVG